MNAEHCTKAGCDVEFETSNYHIKTTPKREWSVAVLGEALSSAESGHGRRIPNIADLRQVAMSLKASLRDFEIFALVLYTGPMVRR